MNSRDTRRRWLTSQRQRHSGKEIRSLRRIFLLLLYPLPSFTLSISHSIHSPIHSFIYLLFISSSIFLYLSFYLYLSISLLSTSILYRRGLAYYFGRRYTHALSDLLDASTGLSAQPSTASTPGAPSIDIPSSLPDCLYHIGLCYACLHDYEKAADWFSRAIQLAGIYAPFLHERAKAYQMMEQFDSFLRFPLHSFFLYIYFNSSIFYYLYLYIQKH